MEELTRTLPNHRQNLRHRPTAFLLDVVITNEKHFVDQKQAKRVLFEEQERVTNAGPNIGIRFLERILSKKIKGIFPHTWRTVSRRRRQLSHRVPVNRNRSAEPTMPPSRPCTNRLKDAASAVLDESWEDPHKDKTDSENLDEIPDRVLQSVTPWLQPDFTNEPGPNPVTPSLLTYLPDSPQGSKLYCSLRHAVFRIPRPNVSRHDSENRLMPGIDCSEMARRIIQSDAWTPATDVTVRFRVIYNDFSLLSAIPKEDIDPPSGPYDLFPHSLEILDHIFNECGMMDESSIVSPQVMSHAVDTWNLVRHWSFLYTVVHAPSRTQFKTLLSTFLCESSYWRTTAAERQEQNRPGKLERKPRSCVSIFEFVNKMPQIAKWTTSAISRSMLSESESQFSVSGQHLKQMTKEVYIKSKDGTDKQGKQPDKVELGMLEEDDEFEEFAAHPMSGDPKKAEEITVWEDNWDDDIVDDEFTHQLRSAAGVGWPQRMCNDAIVKRAFGCVAGTEYTQKTPAAVARHYTTHAETSSTEISVVLRVSFSMKQTASWTCGLAEGRKGDYEEFSSETPEFSSSVGVSDGADDVQVWLGVRTGIPYNIDYTGGHTLTNAALHSSLWTNKFD
ncbi:hypothetical protein CLF_106744 [Clonorchis sinensis]|uniref:26S proteasome complex subunit SEM1 n=1 Tax=Clonorchis sinensis TaxID=79923 RepID=G7YFM6_CLOSI|nr:hypothetical protein CLF_106744 [Clonorchis sinensis]